MLVLGDNMRTRNVRQQPKTKTSLYRDLNRAFVERVFLSLKLSSYPKTLELYSPDQGAAYRP